MAYEIAMVAFLDNPCLLLMNAEVFDVLWGELRECFPKVRVKKGSQGIINYRLDNFGGKDMKVFWWLLVRFGELGWEPFTSATFGGNWRGVMFRKVVEVDGRMVHTRLRAMIE
jgi:hypothetical protein